MRKFSHPCFLFFFCALVGPAAEARAINRREAVAIGGIRQWISVRGANETNPVLLFLHGGPGNSVMGYADKFTEELQKHFVVVLWDQRESGKTASLNTPSDRSLTVDLMENDVILMIDYLRAQFSKKKIYLMGHSWGGFLVLRAASRHPEVLQAAFAVSPMVNQLASERLMLDVMTAQATTDDNQDELRELSVVRIPFQNGEQLYFHRKWLAKYMGTRAPTRGFVESWAEKWLALFDEASQVNLSVDAAEMKCPVYFFVGRKDYQTHFTLTEAYYHTLKAEKKDLFWFTNSAHNLNLTEPKKLQEIVISLITPEN